MNENNSLTDSWQEELELLAAENIVWEEQLQLALAQPDPAGWDNQPQLASWD